MPHLLFIPHLLDVPHQLVAPHSVFPDGRRWPGLFAARERGWCALLV